MEAFLFSVNAVLPIVLLVAVGYLLRRLGLLGNDIAKSINKLVFRVFLPCMLFLNIYKIESIECIDLGFVAYAIIATVVIFVLAVPLVIVLVKENSKRGVTIQAIFRSNYAFVGIPLAVSFFGEEGGIVATLLSAVLIPVYNVLAVVALTVFGDRERIFSVKRVVLGIVKNPLIQAIASGLLALGIRAIFVSADIPFRLSDITPVYSVLSDLGKIATPLALIALGAQFEFSAAPTMKRPLIIGLVTRCIAVPVLSLGIAYLIGGFTGAHYAAFIAAFVTPVATSTVPMAQELGGDAALAGQFVVYSTVISGITVFIASMIFKAIGIFP